MKNCFLYILCSIPLFGIGQQWIKKNAGFSNDSIAVWNISMVSEDTVWAAAYNIYQGSQSVDLEFSRTSDGGNSWETGYFNGIPDSVHLSYLHAYNDQIAWLALWGDSTKGQAIYKTVDGGSNWVVQSSASFTDSMSFANVVYFFDAQNGICMGDPANGYFEHYTTSDGGINWNRVPSENLPESLTDETGYNRGMSFDVVHGIVYYGTSKGRVLKSSDFGYTWTVQEPEYMNKVLYVSFKDSLSGIIVGEGIQTQLTYDGGLNWYLPVFNTDYYGGQIEYAHADSGYYVAAWRGSGSQGSAYSTNDATSWTRIDSIPYTDIQFIDVHRGWAGGVSEPNGEGGMYKWRGDILSIDIFKRTIDIRYFPNPCDDFIIIDSNWTGEIQIIDYSGRTIACYYKENQHTSINVSTLESGMYLLMFLSDNGVFQSKIIKL